MKKWISVVLGVDCSRHGTVASGSPFKEGLVDSVAQSAAGRQFTPVSPSGMASAAESCLGKVTLFWEWLIKQKLKGSALLAQGRISLMGLGEVFFGTAWLIHLFNPASFSLPQELISRILFSKHSNHWNCLSLLPWTVINHFKWKIS